MKIVLSLLISLMVLVTSEQPKPLVFPSWPPKNNQISKAYSSSLNSHPFNVNGKPKRTLLVQIRSENRIPFVLKRSPIHQTAMASHNQPVLAQRPNRPIKIGISPHFMLKGNHLIAKHNLRKPVNSLKIKFGSNTKLHELADKPYVYEKPSFIAAPELLKLPIKNSVQFSNNHFVPIHAVPAPNLATYANNHIHHEDILYTPPSSVSAQFNPHQYQVTEEQTNDQTIIDLSSGQHKYFAPDPDPSLPTAKIRPSTEPFNMPSNSKPFPADIQSNYLPSSSSLSSLKPLKQALVQEFTDDIVGQQYPAEVYGLPVANQPQLQQYLLQQASTPISVYNPTYLVTQSKNLYSQHQLQKQLFKANPITTYGTEDLTQEVASDGQILQSAKDHKNQIHPEFHGTIISSTISPDIPSYAALIGGPPQVRLKQENIEVPETGFIVSNYFGNGQQDPNYQEYVQLSQRQRENDRTLEQANLELQQQLLEQDAPNPESSQPAISAYEEHQRLLQQHLGAAPLRIFVPDEDYQNDVRTNIQKRSNSKAAAEDSYEDEIENPDDDDDDDEDEDNDENDEYDEGEKQSDYDHIEYNDKEIRIDRNNKRRN